MGNGNISVGNAKAIADAAAKNAGGGNVGLTKQKCSRVNLGVFFDGTGNSRELVGKKTIWGNPLIEADHTNVDLLESLYLEGEDTSTGCNVNCDSIYMPGIGCSDTDVDKYGYITGLGIYGVPARVDEAIKTALEYLKRLSKGEPQIEVLIDVFGFSRGSAAARYFCNRVTKEGVLNGAWGEPKIRFIGLFDTVGSIGLPGDEHEAGVDMSTPPLEMVCDVSMPSGQHIYHITAEDEFRKNFPLTKISKGQTISMPGVHSDVGGGYYYREASSTYEESSYSEATRAIEDKWLGGDDKIVWGELIESAVEIRKPWAFHWKAKPGLSRVALHAMHHFATDIAKVPMTAVKDPFPADLQDLFDAVVSGRVLSAERRKEIRQKYAHFSVQNRIGHKPDPSGRRRVFVA